MADQPTPERPWSTLAMAPMTLVYVPAGTVSHYAHTGNELTVTCGLYRPAGWHGTGTQDEHEEAARRPVCRNCIERTD